MEQKPILEEVAKKVEGWRSAKKYRGEALPQEIVDKIKELAKSHKRFHIAKAFKMSGSTLNKILDGNSPCKKGKRHFSAEERLALCQEWRRSGISLEKFCNTHKISRPTFYRWCHHLYPEPKAFNAEWMPVIAKPKQVSPESTISIEIPLPNTAVARVKLLKSEAVDFLQEFYHAITALR